MDFQPTLHTKTPPDKQQNERETRGRKMWCWNNIRAVVPYYRCKWHNFIISQSFLSRVFVCREWNWASIYLFTIIVRYSESVCVLCAILFIFLHREKVNDFTSTQNGIVPLALLPRNTPQLSRDMHATVNVTTQFSSNWQERVRRICVYILVSPWVRVCLCALVTTPNNFPIPFFRNS